MLHCSHLANKPSEIHTELVNRHTGTHTHAHSHKNTRTHTDTHTQECHTHILAQHTHSTQSTHRYTRTPPPPTHTHIYTHTQRSTHHYRLNLTSISSQACSSSLCFPSAVNRLTWQFNQSYCVSYELLSSTIDWPQWAKMTMSHSLWDTHHSNEAIWTQHMRQNDQDLLSKRLCASR